MFGEGWERVSATARVVFIIYVCEQQVMALKDGRKRMKEKRGQLIVVGIGPGAMDKMTFEAYRAMEECDVIAGYHVYVDLVRDSFPDKKFVTTTMRRETERCVQALEEAASGQKVAFICSGDAGVYGLAGLIWEVAQDYPDVEIDVIPGVTAAQVCGTVRNIGREGEETQIYTLEELRNVHVDMFTTVFIGNSSTKRIGDKMVTPRGYAREKADGILEP